MSRARWKTCAACSEVRRASDATREPRPGLDDLEALAERARGTGGDVAVHIDPAALAGIAGGAAHDRASHRPGRRDQCAAPCAGALIEIAVGRQGRELVVQVHNGPAASAGGAAVAASAGTASRGCASASGCGTGDCTRGHRRTAAGRSSPDCAPSTLLRAHLFTRKRPNRTGPGVWTFQRSSQVSLLESDRDAENPTAGPTGARVVYVGSSRPPRPCHAPSQTM